MSVKQPKGTDLHSHLMGTEEGHTHTHTGTHTQAHTHRHILYADTVCSECALTHVQTHSKGKDKNTATYNLFTPWTARFEMVTSVNTAFCLCAKKHIQLFFFSYILKQWGTICH